MQTGHRADGSRVELEQDEARKLVFADDLDLLRGLDGGIGSVPEGNADALIHRNPVRKGDLGFRCAFEVIVAFEIGHGADKVKPAVSAPQFPVLSDAYTAIDTVFQDGGGKDRIL